MAIWQSAGVADCVPHGKGRSELSSARLTASKTRFSCVHVAHWCHSSVDAGHGRCTEMHEDEDQAKPETATSSFCGIFTEILSPYCSVVVSRVELWQATYACFEQPRVDTNCFLGSEPSSDSLVASMDMALRSPQVMYTRACEAQETQQAGTLSG